jgi:alpha-1,6-mannosyltransferase
VPALRPSGQHPPDGLQEPLQQLRHRLSSRRLLRLIPPAAPPLRPGATLTVLDVTKYYGDTTGGVRTYLNEKSAYVAARPSLRHVLVVPGAADEVSDDEGTRTYRLAGPPIPTQAPYRFLHSADALRRIVLHERPDLIEIGSPFLVPWVVRRATRGLDPTLVWFYHGNVPRLISQHPGHDGALRTAGHRLAWGYVRRVSRLVRATLVASDFVAADLEREGVANAVRVPLGVDLAQFHPRRRERREETRRALGLSDVRLAVYCGRLAREKHLDVLIRAWPAVERETGARLALVGDGPSAAWFRSLPGAERVIWLPFERDRDRLADLLAAADLYVAPGPAETFGLAALEALASGTPVLSVDSGGVPELVRRSGAGDVYPVGDGAALAEAAIALIARDMADLGRRGRAYAEREHAWATVFDRIFTVYREVLSA